MRYGFFSDVHSNLEALKVVVADFQKEKIDRISFLGDAVGYGPDPNECTAIINQVADVKLMGNHDYAALGLIETNLFNDYAQKAMEWTKSVLTEKSLKILSRFIMDHRLDQSYLVHSTPKEPQEWNYIFDLDDAEENFNFFSKQICIIGHSHYPGIIKKYDEKHCFLYQESRTEIEKGFRYIINIGSVGQPRDGSNQACYLIYDTKEKIATLKRLPYNFKKTQTKMKKRGLPQFLIDRLAVGR
ncbi:MAG: metallophosphoesterase family protein [candidate division Zixibacteria bacterium]|nr:metallophosphoesterase family protein [candidate division Zixibacteria bacterium]